MKRLLLVQAGTIVGVVSIPVAQEEVLPEDYVGPFDTVVQDDKTLFANGETYTLDEYTVREEPTLTLAEKREKMAISKEQADVAMIALGIKADVDRLVAVEGTRGLQMVWEYTTESFARMGKEILEVIDLLAASGVTNAKTFDLVMDDVFVLGAAVDVANYSTALDVTQLAAVNSVVALEKADAKFKSDVKTLTAGTTFEETSSWPQQKEEAIAFQADSTAATPLLDSLIASRNLAETKADFATLVMGKAATYATDYGNVLGAYQALVKTL